MTIHHAIVKKAAGKGVILTYSPECVTANYAERGISVSFEIEDDEGANELAQDALRDVLEIAAYQDDHAKVAIRHEDGDFVAYHRQGRGLGDEIARDPELADLFESLADPEVNGVEDGDEPEEGGSVVPAKYKAEYAARGNPNHCGDWLAETLARLCRILEDGKEVTDLDRLQAIAQANDVDPAKYGKLGVATNGWQGRFRMTVRNMLTPRVAAKGFLFVPEGCGADHDQELQAPRQWCVEHQPKAKKAADPKAAVKKDEGAGKASAKTKAKKIDGIAEAGKAIRSSKAKEAARRAATK